MENPTCFDLNVALGSWRAELAAYANLTADARRELETHLVDAMAELRQRGLNDEESFWLATHRIGRPQKLAQEFEKADPAKVWRERVFWMVLAYLITSLWNGTASLGYNTVYNFVHPSGFHPGFVAWFLNAWHIVFTWLPIVGCAVLLAKGKLDFSFQKWLQSSRPRRQFMVAAVVWTLFNTTSPFWMFLGQTASGPSHSNMLPFYLSNCFFATAHTLVLIWLLTWLMPLPKGKLPEPA